MGLQHPVPSRILLVLVATLADLMYSSIGMVVGVLYLPTLVWGASNFNYEWDAIGI